MIPFWWSWPSIVVEFISGLVASGMAWCLISAIPWMRKTWQRWVSFTFVLANIFSVVYEVFLDPNHWSLSDVLQRETGIVAAAIIFWLVLRGAYEKSKVA